MLRRHPGRDVVDQLRRTDVRPAHDVRHGELACLLVRPADRGDVGHRGVGSEQRLELGRSDLVREAADAIVELAVGHGAPRGPVDDRRSVTAFRRAVERVLRDGHVGNRDVRERASDDHLVLRAAAIVLQHNRRELRDRLREPL